MSYTVDFYYFLTQCHSFPKQNRRRSYYPMVPSSELNHCSSGIQACSQFQTWVQTPQQRISPASSTLCPVLPSHPLPVLASRPQHSCVFLLPVALRFPCLSCFSRISGPGLSCVSALEFALGGISISRTQRWGLDTHNWSPGVLKPLTVHCPLLGMPCPSAAPAAGTASSPPSLLGVHIKMPNEKTKDWWLITRLLNSRIYSSYVFRCCYSSYATGNLVKEWA